LTLALKPAAWITDFDYWLFCVSRYNLETCGRYFCEANIPVKASEFMTWIRTIPVSEAGEKLRQAMEGQKSLYPVEYATPVHPVEGGGSSITESHSLIPDALYHAFATFGVLMSPDLPLSRRQHEMITTVVSVTNRCVY
jgi:hypothetical protein